MTRKLWLGFSMNHTPIAPQPGFATASLWKEGLFFDNTESVCLDDGGCDRTATRPQTLQSPRARRFRRGEGGLWGNSSKVSMGKLALWGALRASPCGCRRGLGRGRKKSSCDRGDDVEKRRGVMISKRLLPLATAITLLQGNPRLFTGDLSQAQALDSTQQ
jgi:hypothetical protein